MKIENLSYKYKDSPLILDNLSIELVDDKINVLIGLNGAGKTTFLDIITNMIPQSPLKLPLFNHGDIAYQLQGVPIFGVLKGKDLIRLILQSGTDTNFKDNIDSLRGKLTDRENGLLDKLFNRDTSKMSVGERRWLIIQSICQLKRKVYIFDEPTAGIDPDARFHVVNSITSLVDTSRIVIMSTHILHELEHIDCKLHFLHQGNILFSGSYSQFLNQYSTSNPDLAFQEFIKEHEGYNNERALSS